METPLTITDHVRNYIESGGDNFDEFLDGVSTLRETFSDTDIFHVYEHVIIMKSQKKHCSSEGVWSAIKGLWRSC